MTNTYSAKPSEIMRAWYVVDAEDLILGRLAAQIAHRLRGKHKAQYTPHMDTGDYVVVVNADRLRVTGQKLDNKKYYRHTGYPGGIREMNLRTLLAKRPERVLELAVKRMLPRGPLGRQMYRKLKVFAGAEHAHTAQQPIPWVVTAAQAQRGKQVAQHEESGQ